MFRVYFLLILTVCRFSFFFSVPRKSMGFYDPSEIYLHGKLKTHIKFASIRLIFHLTHFFIYLYIVSLSIT